MGLTAAELLPDYQASLSDAAGVFGDDTTTPTLEQNLTRHLKVAALALSVDGKRPLVKSAEFTVVAGTARYAEVPDDLVVPRANLWPTYAAQSLQPWEQPIEPLPAIYKITTAAGDVLMLSPAPTCAQVRAYGSTFGYTYLAAHAVTDDADTSTLLVTDKNLVILRAQVEAMREMAFRNIHKPVNLKAAGGGAVSSNMQPSALYEKLLEEYRSAA